MAVSSNYAIPVQVNGFTCKNCTDVDYAKRHIDPQHPQSGPYGVNAAVDPNRRADAVTSGQAAPTSEAPLIEPTGALLDISA